ncbi:OsmC family protein [Bacillus sp. FJAT-49705]|uniref:OsmC family protein n=1 Tax=Cytobacillus citreus TaxID=2833586 RepID=A0ABS5P0Q7_9BACI|nr:OsmC family protein [Cytobacillus citreus]MBS4192274.1 OsmC family protein [Cytobacillus citreus]MBS4193038.1 OsmC family protein [Cytobacillus citreus]
MNNINFRAVQQMMEAIQSDPALKMRKWHASIKWQDGVRNEVKIRDFEPFMMDEPQPLGGTDQAPNPVEMLIAAAGSCFAITFEVLASQKGITLEDVTVNIEADLNAAVFLGLEEGDGGILNPVLIIKAKTSASKEEIDTLVAESLSKSVVLASLKTDVNVTVS